MIVLLFPVAADASRKSTNEEYQCDQCGKFLKTPKTLRCHKTLHSEPKYVCSICKKTFHNSTLLSNHRRKEHCNKDYKCQLCESEFQFLRQLDKHLATRHGSKRFKCEFKNCDKIYSSREGLRYHKLVHTGLKPYTCEICGKCFGRKGILKNHSDLHDDIKKYTCDVCGRCFSQKQGLDTHVRLHTKEYKATLIKPALSTIQCHQ